MNESGLKLKNVIATADIYELLSLAFSFPDENLARGLHDRTFWKDAATCLGELGSRKHIAYIKVEESSEELLSEMKKEYSWLYHSPGKLAVLYPYESAFMFVQRGKEGLPTLFANPTTQDVEKHMREAGFLPEDFRKEPVDAINKEFDFLRILYTLAAEALQKGDCEAAEGWIKRAEAFRREHLDVWASSFFEKTKETTRLWVYRSFSEVALNALEATALNG